MLISAFSSRPGHGRPFKQFPLAFSGCGERFHEIAMTENVGGKERKINGGTATANQVRDGWKELKQKYLQIESAIKKHFILQPLQRA
jgi:hypothetical protein